MEKGKIFLVKDTGEIVEVQSTQFEGEGALEGYIYKYPEIIPGGQINAEDPCRWLVIGRQIGTPIEEEGGDRFKLDILLVDQDGVLTFVECKLISDSRTRRVVVAQMIDYAANGSVYWPLDFLVKKAEEAAEKRGSNLAEDLASFLGKDDPEEAESFWRKVSENISAGKFRLLFAADSLPTELIRIIEFLNEQMGRTEVLGVEIKQYKGVGEKVTVLVPRIVGLSVKATDNKKITEVEFLAKCSDVARGFFEYLFEKIEEGNSVICWRRKGFSVRVPLGIEGNLISFLYGYPPNQFEVYLHEDVRMEPSKKTELRKYLVEKGFTEGGAYTLRVFVNDGNIDGLKEAADYVVSEFQKGLD